MEQESDIPVEKMALFLPTESKGTLELLCDKVQILEIQRTTMAHENKIMAHENKIMAQNLANSKVEKLILKVSQIEKGLEIAIIRKILYPKQPNLGGFTRIFKIIDLKSTFNDDKAVKKLVEIIGSGFNELDTMRNDISHPHAIHLLLI